MKPIITIQNLGKKYTLQHNNGNGGYRSLREELISLPSKLLKGRKSREDFWALKELDLDIKPGERIGIIGANGAGKSTLLKLLSRITEPSTGRITLRGRVASLLEVGTGFHAELTGRENIYLNGAILGMNRQEVRKKFDEIVDFAGVERFLDTPVKRYSSGMYVRLAFAIAAHLEPEILIIDEVLAVGDAEFQKKCLGRMEDVSKGEGRTVLFVSHNMQHINRLCSRAVVLEAGRKEFDGDVGGAIDYYNKSLQSMSDMGQLITRLKSDSFKVCSIQPVDADGKGVHSFYVGQKIFFKTRISVLKDINAFGLRLNIKDKAMNRLCVLSADSVAFSRTEGKSTLEVVFGMDNILSPGEYELGCNVLVGDRRVCSAGGIRFEVHNAHQDNTKIIYPGMVQAVGTSSRVSYVDDTH